MPDTPERAAPETVLAFDFGLRRIGVAVGQDITGSASPLGIVRNAADGPDHERIAALVAEWRPAGLVVGMPAHADGSATAIHAQVLEFIDQLARYGLPIATIDERYTSVEAQAVLQKARAAGSRGRISKASVDAAAAVFIAERYLAAR